MSTKTMSDLQNALFATLDGIKDGSIDIDKAKAVNEVAKTLVETAKVEVDYLRVTGGRDSGFIVGPQTQTPLPPGITGITQHRLQG